VEIGSGRRHFGHSVGFPVLELNAGKEGTRTLLLSSQTSMRIGL
jgi:hypothetical protein